MQQDVVGEDAGHHGFADGDRAYADAGVMAAFGDDLGLIALYIHRFTGGEDGGGWFDRKTADDFFAGTDPA